jgi:hypothetical protein
LNRKGQRINGRMDRYGQGKEIRAQHRQRLRSQRNSS